MMTFIKDTTVSLASSGYQWVNDRLPVDRAFKTHMSEYYAPKNFNIMYFFGVISLVVLVNQLLTGIWLTMIYTPTGAGAFDSIEYIMRDVEYGWLLRYMHAIGASAFFIVVYLHMFRGLMYGSYQKPRELIWLIGMAIYVALMGEAFMGYLLPWGQMSYWGAQVILSLASAIPVVGDQLSLWIRGDYVISGVTLNRFFALHVVAMPIVLLGLVIVHLLALHEVGSNNPDGIEIKANKGPDGKPVDGVPFHPFYTVHDLVGIVIFLIVFCGIIFFAPDGHGYFLEKPNFEPANPLKTPEHIAPVWYFTPFYAILRAIPNKGLGVIFFAASIAILFVLPWIDRSPVKSMRYRGLLSKLNLTMFAIVFCILGVCGVKAPDAHPFGLTFIDFKTVGQICTFFYFAYFVGLFMIPSFEETKPLPERVTG